MGATATSTPTALRTERPLVDRAVVIALDVYNIPTLNVDLLAALDGAVRTDAGDGGRGAPSEI